jgi:RNA polymerase sigma-70 factor (ECF subfamily)
MKIEATDDELVSLLRAGDTEAFEILIGRYADKAFHLALRLTRNMEDAEEVLQDVFSAVYRKIDKFQGKSLFSSWLYRITVNAAFMRIRRRRTKSLVRLDENHLRRIESEQALCMGTGTIANDSDAIFLQAELRGILQNAVDELPDDYRPVFILRDVDGLSNQEVSRILKISVAAVKSRLHRARLMLRRKLNKDYLTETKQKVA